MGRTKKDSSIDVIKELGLMNGSDSTTIITFVDKHLKKFNTIDNAEAVLWNINISLVAKHPQIYSNIFTHLQEFNFKNPLTINRLKLFRAFILDYKDI